jgi:hypothetical protein
LLQLDLRMKTQLKDHGSHLKISLNTDKSELTE